MFLELERVYFHYEVERKTVTVPAINNVSLGIEHGEFICVVGSSGCGKTTLLKLIAGLLHPVSGTISVDGIDPVRARNQRMFGFVFQNPVLFPWRTVEENIALPFEIFRESVDRERIARLIGIVELAGFEKFYPRQLSGGMRSRVAIARALIYEPKILLLDEPFGDVDEVTRINLNLELVSLWRRLGCTVVFVTHNVWEAGFLGDRVVIMNRSNPSIPRILDVRFPNKDFNCQHDPRFHALRAEILATLDTNFARLKTL